LDKLQKDNQVKEEKPVKIKEPKLKLGDKLKLLREKMKKELK
jgi:hypothetical protein